MVIFGLIIIFLTGSIAATWIKLRVFDGDEIKRLGSITVGHVRFLPVVAGLFHYNLAYQFGRNGITAQCLSANGKTLYSGDGNFIARDTASGRMIWRIRSRDWGFLHGSVNTIIHLPKRREIAVLYRHFDSSLCSSTIEPSPRTRA